MELASFPPIIVKNAAMICVFKILDEVEKRRAISPALVQPFMRGIMEAPFPAPGRTITVKNFLPGSGTEVTLLLETAACETKQRFSVNACAYD